MQVGGPVTEAVPDRRFYFAQDNNISIGKEVAYRENTVDVACSIVIADHESAI